MITVALPDAEMVDVVLEQEQRTQKGFAAAAAPPLDKQLSFGPPVVIALTPQWAGSDPDLLAFITAEAATASYFLVRLACTFNPPDTEPFAQAWLQVTLTRQDGAADPLPIAWSMEPEKQQEKVDVPSSAEIGFDLKLLSGKITSPPSSSNETSLLALYEMQSTPTWELTRTSLDAIQGSYRFRLIVRVPKGAVGQGKIDLTATVQKKHLGLVPYRAAFPPILPQTFSLS